MKRCYFLGLDDIFDAELENRVMEELEKLLAADNQLELWFFQTYPAFLRVCLRLSVLLKSRYPEKGVKIIRVFDLAKDQDLERHGRAHDVLFPCCIPDQNIYSLLIDSGFAKKSNQYVQQSRMVERWILKQCDVLIAYYCPNLPSAVNPQIGYAQKLARLSVINVFPIEAIGLVNKMIDEYPDERARTILQLLNSGKSKREAAQITALSANWANHLASKAIFNILNALKAQKRQQDNGIKRCGIIGLKEDVAVKLLAFESLLKHLTEQYSVKEFWIDEKSSETAYGAALIKYAARQYGEEIKIRLIACQAEGDALHRYPPLYSSIINIGCEPTEQEEICRAVVQQCDCLVTDLEKKAAHIARSLCAEDRHTYLVDVSKATGWIERQYIR